MLLVSLRPGTSWWAVPNQVRVQNQGNRGQSSSIRPDPTGSEWIRLNPTWPKAKQGWQVVRFRPGTRWWVGTNQLRASNRENRSQSNLIRPDPTGSEWIRPNPTWPKARQGWQVVRFRPGTRWWVGTNQLRASNLGNRSQSNLIRPDPTGSEWIRPNPTWFRAKEGWRVVKFRPGTGWWTVPNQLRESNRENRGQSNPIRPDPTRHHRQPSWRNARGGGDATGAPSEGRHLKVVEGFSCPRMGSKGPKKVDFACFFRFYRERCPPGLIKLCCARVPFLKF